MADVKLTITGQNLTKQAIDQLKRDLEQTTQKLNAMNQGTAKVEQETRKARTGVMELAVGLGAVSAATMLVVRSGGMAAIQFQRMKLGLAAVTGSAMAANAQMIEFRKLAKLPGLGLPEVVKAATSLQTLDMSLSTTTQTIKEWGNELVRFGKGRLELDRIVLALTQMIGKGKGFGQEIRQIAEAMPSIRKHMKAAFGTTASEEFKKMGITAQKFIAGITAELAKMPRVAGGAANSMENFTDAVFNARVAMGEAFLPALTKALDVGTKLLEQYSEMPKSFREMTSWSLLAVGGITALGAAVASAVFVVDKAIIAFKALAVAMTALSLHPAFAPAVAIAAVAAALGVMYAKSRMAKDAVIDLGKSMADAKASFDKFAQMDRLINEIDRLREKKERTVEETKRLEQAQKDIIALEPRMLAYYDKEGKAIADTTEKMKEKIEQMREVTFQQLQMNAAEARRKLPEVTKEVEKLTDSTNALYKKWRDFEQQADEASASRSLLVRRETQTYKDLAASNKQFYESDAKRLEEKITQQARLSADLEAYQKALKDIRIAELPKPEALERAKYETTKEEKEAFLELQKARAEAIEDEYSRRMALAEAAFKSETQGFDEERKAIKASEASQDEKYAKLQALDAKLQAASIRRETAIREAGKKRSDEVAKLAQDAQDELEKMIADSQKAFQDAEDAKAGAARDRIEETARLENLAAQRVEDATQRAIANAYTEYRQKSAILQQELDDTTTTEERKTVIIGEMNQLRLNFENESARLRQKIRDDELADIKKKADEEARIEKKRLAELAVLNKKDREIRIKQNERLMEITKRAQDAIKAEQAKAFDAYYTAEEMRISLIAHAKQRALEQARLEYETKVKFIKAELAEAKVSADRRAELERQLVYLTEQYARDIQRIKHRMREEILYSTSEALAKLPFDFARSLWEARGLAKEYADDIQNLQEETAREADRISSDYTKSAAQKHRELERLEKESAQRRLEIEKRMDQERRDIYTDFVKNFFAQIMREMENILIREKIVPKIFGFLEKQFTKPEVGGSVVSAGIGLATGNPFAVLAEAIPFLVGQGFDNPANDALAKAYGQYVAIHRASFDVPLNDLNAKLAGARTAAYGMGRRSADDMVENFTAGFIQQGGADRSRRGISDDEVTEILKDLGNALENSAQALKDSQRAMSNPPPFQLTIDGRELNSVIQRIADRTKARQEGY